MRTNKPYSLTVNRKKNQLVPVSQKPGKTNFLQEHSNRLVKYFIKLVTEVI